MFPRVIEVDYLKALAVLPISALLFALTASAGPASAADASTEIIERYVAASSQSSLRGVSMEVDFEARLPKLKREGKLHALRFISRVGQVRYVVDKFVGDNSVKKDVIARYMSAETQAVENKKSSDTSVTPENYKFKYKGLSERDGRQVHVFQVNPRKKRVGLFKGELWIDPTTYLAVRESGQLVKTPSIFLKKVQFVRNYEIVHGQAVPTSIMSVINTRFWGPAELHINFRNLSHTADADPLPCPATISELH